jgi:TonB family protein
VRTGLFLVLVCAGSASGFEPQKVDAVQQRCETNGEGRLYCQPSLTTLGAAKRSRSIRRMDGWAEATFCVSEGGRPEQIRVSVSSGSSVLDAQALKDAELSRFKPGTLDGQATRMCGVRLMFRYQDVSH